MKAIEITKPGEICLSERPDPELKPGEVLLQVNCVGYCGSDLGAFRGANPLVTYPRVPGHEIGATVKQLGPGVTGWTEGQQVLVMPYNNCGKCSSCLKNRPNACQHNETLGVQRDGAMCEFYAAPVEKLLSSDKLSLAQLALVEPLTVGFHAAARGEVDSTDTVGVFGCGAIGLGAIAGAAFRGARVIAIDIEDEKLEVAKACGAAEGINSRTESFHDRLQELTDGHGPDVMIEAVGHPATYTAAVEEVAFAGRVVYIGWAKSSIEYETKFFVMKELDIRGSRNALPLDFADVIRMLEAGKFPMDQVVTREVSLADSPGAMVQWDKNPADVTKIHVHF